jgi:hypothetical protein
MPELVSASKNYEENVLAELFYFIHGPRMRRRNHLAIAG